jgi:hypothetical protein
MNETGTGWQWPISLKRNDEDLRFENLLFHAWSVVNNKSYTSYKARIISVGEYLDKIRHKWEYTVTGIQWIIFSSCSCR